MVEMQPRRKIGLTVYACILLFLPNAAYCQNCPSPPVATINSPQVPVDVCVPPGFAGDQIQFFDDYSWRSFIAVVWPAANGYRGQPDTSKKVRDDGPRVFETFKSLWETFHNDGSTPAPWNDYDAPQFNACNVNVKFGDLVLASFSKFSDLGQAGVGSLVGPLVAQNRTYIRYVTGLNQNEFERIVSDKLFLRENIRTTAPFNAPFQSGALSVKSAWMLMANVSHPERYYRRTALVLDPQTGKCSQMSIGLVGLHIVQKTPTRPQWIWSTFEQIDNVPPAEPGSAGTFNFNDGKGEGMPDGNPYPIDPPILPPPPPFNVVRLPTAPINPHTLKTNTAYRNLLEGSVWQHYQLVMTQWPLQASQPNLPGTPSNTFPPGNPTAPTPSAFANVTMETFGQRTITSGCMNCHNFTRLQTDFLWSLKDHAFPPPANSGFLLGDPVFIELRNLLISMAGATKLIPAMPAQPTGK
jgi:hypothetical protein